MERYSEARGLPMILSCCLSWRDLVASIGDEYIWLYSSVMLVRSANADVFFRVHEQQSFKKRVQIIRHEKLLDTGRVCSRRQDRDYYIVYGVCARCVRSVTDSDLFWALRPTPIDTAQRFVGHRTDLYDEELSSVHRAVITHDSVSPLQLTFLLVRT